MPFIPLEELDSGNPTKGSKFIPLDQVDAQSDSTADQARLKRVNESLSQAEAVSLVERSLRGVGLDTPVTAGDIGGRADLSGQVNQAVNEDEQLREVTRQRFEINELRESIAAIPTARSLQELQKESIQNIPRPLRPFVTGIAKTGLANASLIARGVEAIGIDLDVADALNRESTALSQARAELGSSQIEDAVEGAVTSLSNVLVGGKLLSGAGLAFSQVATGIAIASGARVANESITSGRDAGLEGLELASFAAGQGTIETAVTLLFGKILGPGLEAAGAPLKEAGKAGIKEALKRFGISTLAELPEEMVINIMSAAQQAMQGVDPDALTEALTLRSFFQTTLTTMLTLGAAQGVQSFESRQRIKGVTKTAPRPTQPAEPQVDDTKLTKVDDQVDNFFDIPAELEALIFEGTQDTPAGPKATFTDPGTGTTFLVEPGKSVTEAQQEAVQRFTEAAGPPQAEVVTEAPKAPVSDVSPKEPKRLTSQQRVAETRKARKVRKSAKKQPDVATEAQAFQEAKTKTPAPKTERQFFGEGFRRAAAQGRQRLASVKEALKEQAAQAARRATVAATDKAQQKEELESGIRDELTLLAKEFLPTSESGKLLTAIKNAKTPRQAQAVRGRIAGALEKVAKRDADTRVAKAKKKINFRRIEASVMDLIGKAQIQALKSSDVKNLTAEEANNLADQLEQVATIQKELKNLRLGTQAKSLDDLTREVRDRVVKTGKFESEDTTSVNLVNEFFTEQNLKPEELMVRMDGEEAGPIRQALYQAPKEGMSRAFDLRRQAKTFFDKRLDTSKFRKWSAQDAGRKVVTETFKLESGKSLKVTRNELIYLVASIDTEANRTAILKSGLSLRRQSARPKTKLTERDLDVIKDGARKADPEILKAAAVIKQYLNIELGPQYNKAHVELNGFSNLVEGEYLPIRRNTKEQLPTSFDINTFNAMALGEIRESKERTGGSSSVMIDDAFAVMDNHVRRMSGFIGLARTLRNANMVLNHPRVAKSMDTKFGTQRRQALSKRFDSIVQDLVGYRPTSSNFIGRLTSKLIDNATVGVLSANPAVILKQPVSIMAASTEIESKFLARAAGAGARLGKVGTRLAKAVDERMIKNNPDIWARYQAPRLRLVGQFVDQADANIVDRAKGLGEKLMAGISEFDRAAIRVIYRASEIKVTETTALKAGTPEYIAAVNKVANTVIDRTQPAFNVMDQAGIALEGRTNALAKLSTAMFMSQRNQNFNIIRRALRRGGRKGIRDLTVIMALSPLFIMAIDEMRRWAYGYDDDRTTTEKVTGGMVTLIEQNLSTVYGAQLAVDLLQPVRKMLLGEAPGQFRQSENVLEGVGRQLGQGTTDLIAAAQAAGETISTGDKRGQSKAIQKLLSGITNLTYAVGSGFGLPISSPLRTAIGVGGRIMADADYSVMFKERGRLRKLLRKEEETGKTLLSDFQREKLGVMEEAIVFSNLAHLNAEKGIITREEANLYITERVSRAIQTIERLENGVPTQTLSKVEKPKEDEVLARQFLQDQGSTYFKFAVLKKEAGMARREFKTIRPTDRAAFLRLNPEIAGLIKKDAQLRVISATVAKLRRVITNPKTTVARREALTAKVKALLQKAVK